MLGFTIVTLLATSPLFARAAPTDANIALARKYAPQLKFHKNEKYWGSSVEYFLGGPITIQDDNGATVSTGSLTPSNLADVPNKGTGTYITTPMNAEAKAGFLAGQNPSKTKDAKIYTFIAPKDNGVVDLYYWLFTPYNLAKTVPLLGEVGNHVGDWERLTVRTVNGTATSVDYHAHGDTGSGTLPWDKVKKFDNDQRPVGYVADGSHGFWSSAGTFTYVNAVIFKLQDKTGDDGVAWDTRDSLVTINYPDTYSGDLSWLNYKGRWGNKGSDDCWWHFIYDECELITGPNGPLRDNVLGAAFAGSSLKSRFDSEMNKPFSHTLAKVANSHSSTYKFHAKAATPYVAVQQICAAGEEAAGHKVKHIKVSADGNSASVQEPETVSRYGSAAVSGSSTSFAVSVPACPAGTTVQSYKVGTCATSAVYSCNWTTEARAIRAFSTDALVDGPQTAAAVAVDDLDTWKL